VLDKGNPASNKEFTPTISETTTDNPLITCYKCINISKHDDDDNKLFSAGFFMFTMALISGQKMHKLFQYIFPNFVGFSVTKPLSCCLGSTLLFNLGAALLSTRRPSLSSNTDQCCVICQSSHLLSRKNSAPLTCFHNLFKSLVPQIQKI
jgi:hypothetical protein